jgi:intraflagellar transport protein 46
MPERNQNDDEDEEAGDNENVPGQYNPADYANLNVTDEVKDLFKYITRFRPINVELDSKLKAFVPDYIPAVGEVDAFLKPSKPDNNTETLGLLTIVTTNNSNLIE